MNFKIIHFLDCLELLGEEDTKNILLTFSSINVEVETFLKNNAISFNKQHQAVTYLVMLENEDELILSGYFSLSVRPTTINCAEFSKTRKNKLRKIGRMNEDETSCSLSAYLIAQFGKNFEFNVINGNELMKLALQTIRPIQYQIGGSVIFLEAEDHEKLLNFYQNTNNQYIPFDDRITKDGTKLIQLYRFV